MSDIVKVSDAVALGIHAAVMLAAWNDKPYSCKQLAETLSVSENHLSKVMQRLSRAGIVVSRRGPRGGFVLARPASEITFLHVFEAIEGALTVPGCLIRQPKCNGSGCVMGDLLHEIHRQTRTYFTGTTLARLAGVIRKKQ